MGRPNTNPLAFSFFLSVKFRFIQKLLEDLDVVASLKVIQPNDLPVKPRGTHVIPRNLDATIEDRRKS